jgi:hypothetical protein
MFISVCQILPLVFIFQVGVSSTPTPFSFDVGSFPHARHSFVIRQKPPVHAGSFIHVFDPTCPVRLIIIPRTPTSNQRDIIL